MQTVNLALVLVQVLFALNYVVSKVLVMAMPPLIWATGRSLITALIFVTIGFLLRIPHPKLTRKFLLGVTGFSLLGIVLNQALFLTGLAHTTSTNCSILATLVPVFTLLIAIAEKRERFNLVRFLGIMVSLSGVLIMLKVENFTFSNKTIFGDFLIILNTLSLALFLAMSKNFVEQNSGFWVTSWLFIVGTFGFLVLSIPQWSQYQPVDWTPTLIGAAVYAILGATVLAYFLNNWALKRTAAPQVALLIYIQPALTAVIAWWWLGEAITLRTYVSGALIFVGVYFATFFMGRSKRPMAQSTSPPTELRKAS